MDARTLGRGLADVAPAAREGASARGVSPRPTAHLVPVHATSFAVASGKGGTGKTVLATNIALTLARGGGKVLLVDADLGLGNTHLQLGVEPPRHIGHYLTGRCTIEAVPMEVEEGLWLLPAGSGDHTIADLTLSQWPRLVAGLRTLSAGVDIVLLDCPSGITAQVGRLIQLATQVIVVVAAELPAVVDAYALIKTMHGNAPRPINIVINRHTGREEAGGIYQRLSRLLQHSLQGEKARWLGLVPDDLAVRLAVHQQQPVVRSYPESAAATAIMRIVERLGEIHQPSIFLEEEAYADYCHRESEGGIRQDDNGRESGSLPCRAAQTGLVDRL